MIAIDQSEDKCTVVDRRARVWLPEDSVDYIYYESCETVDRTPSPLFVLFCSVYFVAAPILQQTPTPHLKRCTMAWYITTAMKLSILFQFIHLLYRPRARRAKAETQGQGERTATTDSAIVPSDRSPPDPTPPSNALQHERQGYYDLAQQLRQISPPTCKWLEPDDVLIVETSAFSSGGFSEVWQGSLQGLAVAVKTLRCYSSPEFDPAEVGIVRLPRSMRLG